MIAIACKSITYVSRSENYPRICDDTFYDIWTTSWHITPCAISDRGDDLVYGYGSTLRNNPIYVPVKTTPTLSLTDIAKFYQDGTIQ